MKKKKNKGFAILPILCLVAATLFSCGENDAKTSEDARNSPQEGQTEPVEAGPAIEAVDLGGRDFVILNRIPPSNYPYHIPEFAAEAENGETINDAIYKRNLYLEEKYNIRIVSVEKEPGDISNDTRNTSLAGDDAFSIVSTSMAVAFPLAAIGCLCEIHSIPHINTEKPWWMNAMEQALSINGKIYFLSGDMNIAAFNATSCMFFNKELRRDYALEDPYSLVEEGKWTIDKLSELSKNVSRDVNGDGILDYNDQFGILAGSWAWAHFFYASDNIMIKKDASDIPYFEAFTEREYNVIAKFIETVNDLNISLNINREKLDVSLMGQTSANIFSDNRGLFNIGFLYDTTPMREMENDFGILPLPKHDESQKDYRSNLHSDWSSSTCVPISNGDIDGTGRVLEDMAYQSSLTARPAFYEITLKTKVSRDSESEKMLDIICKNPNIDLCLAMKNYGIDIDQLLRQAGTDNNINIISKVDQNLEKYNAIIREVCESFAN